MQPDHAVLLRGFLLATIESESNLTRRVIERIPQAKCDYRPERRIRSAFELAWHIISCEIWFLEGILNGVFMAEEPRLPPQIKTFADLLDWYGRTLPELLERLCAMKPEELARPADFFGVAHEPAVAYLHRLTSHTIHHRGQLALYLRLMGEKVPSIYGGTWDEPFQMAAQG